MSVTVTANMGNSKHIDFGCFENLQTADHYIALAKATSGIPGFIDYSKATFTVMVKESAYAVTKVYVR